jgi:hypothetical protein
MKHELVERNPQVIQAGLDEVARWQQLIEKAESQPGRPVTMGKGNEQPAIVKLEDGRFAKGWYDERHNQMHRGRNWAQGFSRQALEYVGKVYTKRGLLDSVRIRAEWDAWNAQILELAAADINYDDIDYTA